MYSTKKLQGSQNSNLIEEREKNSWKNIWTIDFSSFLDYDQTNLDFYRNFSDSVVKITFYVSRATHLEQLFRKYFVYFLGFSEKY